MNQVAPEKVQFNVQVLPSIKDKVAALGRLTSRSLPGDVVAWLVEEKYEELIGKLEPAAVKAPGDE